MRGKNQLFQKLVKMFLGLASADREGPRRNAAIDDSRTQNAA